MQIFEYKIAPIGRRQRVIVEADSVRIEALDGSTREALRFAALRRARFVVTGVRDMVLQRLDLEGERGQRVRINFNGAGTPSAGDLEQQTFLRSLVATTAAVAAARPELDLELGEGRGGRWAMFAIGIFAASAGGAMLVSLFTVDLERGTSVFVALPMAGLLALGLSLMRKFAPWRPLPRASFRELGAALAQSVRSAP